MRTKVWPGAVTPDMPDAKATSGNVNLDRKLGRRKARGSVARGSVVL